MDLTEVKEKWKAQKLEEYQTKLESRAETQAVRMEIDVLKSERRDLLMQINDLKKLLPAPIPRPRKVKATSKKKSK